MDSKEGEEAFSSSACSRRWELGVYKVPHHPGGLKTASFIHSLHRLIITQCHESVAVARDACDSCLF